MKMHSKQDATSVLRLLNNSLGNSAGNSPTCSEVIVVCMTNPSCRITERLQYQKFD